MSNFKVTATLYTHGAFGHERKEYVVKASNKQSAEALVVSDLVPGNANVDCHIYSLQITSAYARQLRKRGYKSIKVQTCLFPSVTRK